MKKAVELIDQGGLSLFIDRGLRDHDKILVAFTTRVGGNSRSPFNLLNLAFHVGDDPEKVNSNRGLLAEALKFDPRRLTLAKQVHGGDIAVVEEAGVGSGSRDHESAIEGKDALITSLEDVPLAVLAADCVPIVIIAPKDKVVAVIHAGWRGTLNRIAERAITAFSERFSVKPKDLVARVGPSIRACCYKVGDDLVARFKQEFAEIVGDENYLDLPIINIHQMINAGIAGEHIDDLGICTYCRDDLFFSYRHRSKTGRQGVVAMIMEGKGERGKSAKRIASRIQNAK